MSRLWLSGSPLTCGDGMVCSESVVQQTPHWVPFQTKDRILWGEGPCPRVPGSVLSIPMPRPTRLPSPIRHRPPRPIPAPTHTSSGPPPSVPLGPFQGPSLPPPPAASADRGPHRHTTVDTHPHTLSVRRPAAPPVTPGDAYRHSTHTDDKGLQFCRGSQRHQSIHFLNILTFCSFLKRLEGMFGQNENHSFLFFSRFVFPNTLFQSHFSQYSETRTN